MHASRMSHIALLGLGLVAASCAGAGRAAPAVAIGVPEGEAQPAVVETPLVPCPSAEEVADLVVETARIPAQDPRRLTQCQEGLFPGPGWVIIADSDMLEHVAVIDALTRKVLAVRTEISSSQDSEDSEDSNQTVILELAEVADLDGDRVDELVQLWRAAGPDAAVQTLVVERLEGGNLYTVLSRQIGWSSLPADESCVASVAVAEPDPDGKRRILISVEPSGRGLEPERCTGAVYELTDGQLVDVTPQETAAESIEPYDFEDDTAPGANPGARFHPDARANPIPRAPNRDSQDGQADGTEGTEDTADTDGTADTQGTAEAEDTARTADPSEPDEYDRQD